MLGGRADEVIQHHSRTGGSLSRLIRRTGVWIPWSCYCCSFQDDLDGGSVSTSNAQAPGAYLPVREYGGVSQSGCRNRRTSTCQDNSSHVRSSVLGSCAGAVLRPSGRQRRRRELDIQRMLTNRVHDSSGRPDRQAVLRSLGTSRPASREEVGNSWGNGHARWRRWLTVRFEWRVEFTGASTRSVSGAAKSAASCVDGMVTERRDYGG